MQDNPTTGYVIAAAAGLLVFLVLMVPADYGFWPALVLGLLAAGLALLLARVFLAPVADRPAPPATRPVPQEEPEAIPPAGIAAARPAPRSAPPAHRPPARPPPAPVRTAPPATQVKGSGDDLTRIRGIGRRIEGQLHAMGVTRFAEIAAWTDEDVARVDATLKFAGRIRRDDWVGQAKLLAGGQPDAASPEDED